MNTIPLWLKLSIGTVCIVLLTLAGFQFKGIELAPNNPAETPKLIPTQVPSNSAIQSVEIKILVINAKDKKPIENAEVKLIVSNGSPDTKNTDDDGYVSFNIPKGVKTRVFITKEKFKMRDKIFNETIDPNEVKIYYLIPDKEISSLKPPIVAKEPSSSFKFPIAAKESSPSFKFPIVAKEPSPSPKPSIVAKEPSPSPKPSIVVKEPSPSPKPSILETAPQETFTNPELTLLDRYRIDIFF